MKHLDCKQCKAMLFDYVSDLTTDRQNGQMKDHLAQCSVCQKEYQEITKMLDLLSQIEEPELPDGFQLQLHQKLVEVANGREKKPSFLESLKDIFSYGGWKTVAPALVCLVLVIGVFGSGLYEDWKDADSVLVEEGTVSLTVEPKQNEGEEEHTAEPVIEEKQEEAFNQARTQPAKTVPSRTESTDQKEPVVSSQEKEITDEGTLEDMEGQAGIALASEPMIEGYRMRAVDAEVSEEVTAEEETTEEDVTLDTEDALTEDKENAEEEITEEETVAMSSYRVSVQQSVIAYLDACKDATGIDWSFKAESLSEDGAILILSEDEWKIFSDYLTVAGLEPTLVHSGTAGVAVIIQR